MPDIEFSNIHPNTVNFLNGLITTLGFEKNRIIFWNSLSEINRKYLARKFPIPVPTKLEKDATIIPQVPSWVMFKELTDKPELYCLVEVSFQLKLIDSNKKSDLLNELFGLDQENKISKTKTRPSEEKPIWIKSEGLLKFKEKVVLKTQVRRKMTIIQEILQAFQDQNWPGKIEDPFFKTLMSNRRFSIAYLNKLAKNQISFSWSADKKFIQCHY